MDSVLSALHEVPGVTATMVFDAAGRLALHKGHAMYDRPLCEHVAGLLVKPIHAVQLQPAGGDSMGAQCADGRIRLHTLGAARLLAVVGGAARSRIVSAVAMRIAVNKLNKGL